MKHKNTCLTGKILGYAMLFGVAITSLCSCNKKDTAGSGNNNVPLSSGNRARITSCNNPFEWIGISHNTALSAVMSSSSGTSSPELVLRLTKTAVTGLTQDAGILDMINAYPKAALAASAKLSNALISGDNNVVSRYCTAEETVLLKELFAITKQHVEASVAIDQIKDWACGVQNNPSMTNELKEKMLVASAVMVKSIDYWHETLGGTIDVSRHWFCGDCCGAVIGFAFGGGWGAVVGAVAGSVLVGMCGWEISIT